MVLIQFSARFLMHSSAWGSLWFITVGSSTSRVAISSLPVILLPSYWNDCLRDRKHDKRHFVHCPLDGHLWLMVVCILYVLKSCQFNTPVCLHPVYTTSPSPNIYSGSIRCHILISQRLCYISSMEGNFINFILLQLHAVRRCVILQTNNRQEPLTR